MFDEQRDQLQQWWARKDPQTKQYWLWGGVAVAIVGVLFVFGGGAPQTQDTGGPLSDDKAVGPKALTGGDIDEEIAWQRWQSRMDSLEKQMQSMTERNESFRTQLDDVGKVIRQELQPLKKEVEENRKQMKATRTEMDKRISNIRKEVAEIRTSADMPKDATGDASSEGTSEVGGSGGDDSDKTQVDWRQVFEKEDQADQRTPRPSGGKRDRSEQSEAGQSAGDDGEGKSGQEGKKTPPPKPPDREIEVVGQDSISAGPSEGGAAPTGDGKAPAGERPTFIPANSIMSGVLITGMDAPTSGQARQNPVPAVIRVKKDAILPNRFKMDVRECFAQVSGHGDLSSERVKLRGEKLTCVREDGGVIETALKGYVTGEDGKAGIRGRLVHRSGSAIGRTIMAGFISGMGEALKPQFNPQSETGDEVFVPEAGEAGKAAALGGTSKGMKKLANYYINLAEQIFPVLEVDSGRKVDFILTDGITLKLANQDDK